MNTTPSLRTFALTSHVTSSIEWIGAVAAYIVLNVAALTGQDVT